MKKLKIYSFILSIIVIVLMLRYLKQLHDYKPGDRSTVYTIILTNKTDKNINELNFAT